MASLLQMFSRVKDSGRAERFINNITGETISRRQYDKLRRGISNEKLAIANKAINEAEQLARPARGRASAKKYAPAIQADIVKARQEEKERKARLKQQEKEARQREREALRLRNKKIKTPKRVTGQLLRAGHYARRIEFESYEEYRELLESAKASKLVFAYGLGWTGIDNRDNRRRDVTVITMQSITNKPLSEARFEGEMETSFEEKAYLEFLNYWMHLAFDIKYAKEKAAKAGKRIYKPKK